ncbi:MAG: histidine kinase [Cytophagales bacterium]|nr:MAG: histidine kinase [Cytophagales bacterium]
MKHFLLRTITHIFLILLLCFFFAYSTLYKQWVICVLSALLLIWCSQSLLYHVNRTNRKLTNFFEAIKYNDFNIKYTIDNGLGKNFGELNQQLNEVLEAFQQTRAENEANLHYLNNIVQNIDVGILSFDDNENVTLSNQTTLKLLNIYRLTNLQELNQTHNILYEKIKNISNTVFYEPTPEKQILIHKTSINLRGKKLHLLSLQNIRNELQQKELEAWQNLTKILRHEIMNSVAPIVSLVGTMQEIVSLDVKEKSVAIDDLKQALETIENRGKGVMNFVSAYREFTSIPKPFFVTIDVKSWIENVVKLMKNEAEKQNITLRIEIKNNFIFKIDVNLMEQVLINLLKNAYEATEKKTNKLVEIIVLSTQNQFVIEIKDNGIGIEKQALDKIFIPFYSTKTKGSGIGLSLSKQILQLHDGYLEVISKLNEGSSFFVIINQK